VSESPLGKFRAGERKPSKPPKLKADADLVALEAEVVAVEDALDVYRNVALLAGRITEDRAYEIVERLVRYAAGKVTKGFDRWTETFDRRTRGRAEDDPIGKPKLQSRLEQLGLLSDRIKAAAAEADAIRQRRLTGDREEKS
jgi:hypothetical protein